MGHILKSTQHWIKLTSRNKMVLDRPNSIANLAKKSKRKSTKRRTSPKRKSTKRRTSPKRKSTKRASPIKKSSPFRSYRSGRPSPSSSATMYPLGTVRVGNDGNKWKIIIASNGVRRWSRV